MNGLGLDTHSSNAQGHLDCQLRQDYLRTSSTRPHHTAEKMSHGTALPLVGLVLAPGQRTFCLGWVLVLTDCKLTTRQPARANRLLSPTSISPVALVASLIGWPCSLLSDFALDSRSDSSNEVQGRFEEAAVLNRFHF